MKTLRILITLLAFGALSGLAQAKAPLELHYFDGHMHTTHSDGSGSLEDVKQVAKARGLSAVIVTNHTKQIESMVEWTQIVMQCYRLSERGFLMIPSFEITGSEGLFCRDHILAWNVWTPFVGNPWEALSPEEVWPSPANPFGTGPLYPEVIRQWTDWVREKRGISVHAHTTGTTQLDYNVDYIELINLSHTKDVAHFAQMAGFTPEEAWDLGVLFNSFAVFGDKYLQMPVNMPNPYVPGTTIELSLQQALFMGTSMIGDLGENSGGAQWLGSNTPQALLDAGAMPAADLNSWDDLLMAYLNGEIDHPVFGCANSDAHNTAHTEIGSLENDDSDVGEAKNGVYLTRLTRSELFKAVKNGNLFATTGPSLHFEINGKIMGETSELAFKHDPVSISLQVDSQSPTSTLVEVNIICNGEVIYQADPMAQTFDLDLDLGYHKDCYYRVEVIAMEAADGKLRFAYSNPIFVKYAGQKLWTPWDGRKWGVNDFYHDWNTNW